MWFWRRVGWIPVVVWMGVIFWFSAQPAEVSSEMSVEIGYRIGSIIYPSFETWTIKEQLDYALAIEFAVRKAAHALEYAALGMLFLLALKDTTLQIGKIKLRQHIGYAALIFGMIYAISDEIHQIFVPGRDGNLTDVLIDSAGVLIGILLIKGIARFRLRFFGSRG